MENNVEVKKLNVYQKINEVKKTVKNFTKDAETSGKGAYSYTSGTQILSAIKEKMEEVGLLFIPVGTEHRGYQTYNYQNSYGDNKTDLQIVEITQEQSLTIKQGRSTQDFRKS